MINLKKLEWDSNFFEINIAELNLDHNKINKKLFHEIINQHNFDFIQSRVNITDLTKIKELEELRFNFSDLKVTFTMNISEANTKIDTDYSVATKLDIDLLKNISKGIFIDSRYYGYEKFFSKRKVDELYELWLEKSIIGEFDDICLVNSIGNRPVGFITLKILNNTARIGLIGVSKCYQGQGLGGKLIESAISFLLDKKIYCLDVSTQGKNLSAENFYIKNGFKLKEIESWYYLFIERK